MFGKMINPEIQRNNIGNQRDPYAFNLEHMMEERTDLQIDQLIQESFNTNEQMGDILNGNIGKEGHEWDAINSFFTEVDTSMELDVKQENHSPTYSFSPEELMQNNSFNQLFDPDEFMSPVNLNCDNTSKQQQLPTHLKQNSNYVFNEKKPTKELHQNLQYVTTVNGATDLPGYKQYKTFVPIKPKIESKGNTCEKECKNPFSSLQKKTISKTSGKFLDNNDADQNLDLQQKIFKRQQRIVRNRESALHSRKRKKELMQTLEITVNTLSSLNNQLKVENDCLKETIKQLETENWKLKKKKLISFPEMAKKTSYVLVVFVFLAINLKQTSLPSSSSSDPLRSADLYKIPSRHGRLLLEYKNKVKLSERNLMYQNTVYDQQKQSFHPKAGINGLINGEIKKRFINKKIKYLKEKENDELKRNSTIQSDPSCLTSFNETELFRLNEALETLVKTEKKKSRKEKLNKKNARKLSTEKKDRLKTTLNCSNHNNNNHTANCTKRNIRREHKKLRMKKKLIKSNEVQVFQQDLSELNKLQKAINRQPNTFYVMSFRKDHIIFPATQVNNTQRPKLSFILPLPNQFNRNETLESIAMVQIDCQVMDTKTLNISRNNALFHLFDSNRH